MCNALFFLPQHCCHTDIFPMKALKSTYSYKNSVRTPVKQYKKLATDMYHVNWISPKSFTLITETVFSCLHDI